MSRWRHEHDFDAILARVSREQAIALPVVQALVATESAFNPAAVKQESGGRASIGLTQILLGTAQSVGFNGAAADLADPYTNVSVGVRYLLHQYGLARQWAGAYSAYNGGWNPAHGMGVPVTVTTTVIVDSQGPDGQPVYRTAKPGEYGNQPNVDRFMANLDYFKAQAGIPTSGQGGPVTGGTSLLVIGGVLLTLAVVDTMLVLGKR